MRVITAGHSYAVKNFNNPQLDQIIHFIHKVPDGDKLKTVHDGTTNEEVLAVLIDRITYLNSIMPDYHNEMCISLLKSGLNHLQARTVERMAQGVEGTNKPTVQNIHKTNYP